MFNSIVYEVTHCSGCSAWQSNLVPVPNFTQEELKVEKRKAFDKYV